MALIGSRVDLTYDYTHLGDSAKVLEEILSGRHPFSKEFTSAKRPMVVIGSSVISGLDGPSLLGSVVKLANMAKPENEKWAVLNVLHKVGSVRGVY